MVPQAATVTKEAFHSDFASMSKNLPSKLERLEISEGSNFLMNSPSTESSGFLQKSTCSESSAFLGNSPSSESSGFITMSPSSESLDLPSIVVTDKSVEEPQGNLGEEEAPEEEQTL